MSEAMQYIQLYLKQRSKQVVLFFLIFYIVGIVGLLLPVTYPLFTRLTPLALSLSFLAIILYHPHRWQTKEIKFFALVYILSFTIEALGVHTGAIFGNYTYGAGLGLKLWDTPLLIGLNWVFMLYASAAIMENVRGSMAVKIIGGASLMVLYDLVLEQVAHPMDMWSWAYNEIPLQNYAAWFALAIVFHAACRILQLNAKSYMAVVLYAIQFAFFTLLMFTLSS